MNIQFMIVFPLLIVLHIFLNLKHWGGQAKGIRRFYVVIMGLAFALYVAVALHVEPPMPTRFFIDRISPWVLSIIHPR